jgi:hypothetical protein
MKIGIGVDQVSPPSQSSDGWQLAYAWATTLAPSIQTTQRQDTTITALVPNAQASGIAPVVDTSSALNVNVSPTVVNAQASAGMPVVDTTKSPNVLVPIANAQATAGVPSVSTGTTVNASVSSVVAGANASAVTPTVSATSGGGGTTYLQLDGVDDWIKTPVMSYTKILIDMTHGTSLTGSYLYDSLAGEVYENNDIEKKSGYGTLSVVKNGVTSTANNFNNVFSADERGVLTADTSVRNCFLTFFTHNGTSGFKDAKVYDIKIYNGATLVAWYDMSTGTVQDQSSNGNHAILNGGTWAVA